MLENRDGEQSRRWFFRLKRASVVTVLTTIFLVTVYGAGVYALTRTGTAGASRGPAGKPCSADDGHPFKHGHTATCSTTSTTSSTISIGSTSFSDTSSPGSTSIVSGSFSDTSSPGSTSVVSGSFSDTSSPGSTSVVSGSFSDTSASTG
jgi:hypothetical protein